MCLGEMLVPVVGEDLGIDVSGRRAQAFVLENGEHLLWRAPEVVHRPEELDVVVARRTDGGHGTIRVVAHRMPHRVELETNAMEPLGREQVASRHERASSRRAKGLDERSSFHVVTRGCEWVRSATGRLCRDRRDTHCGGLAEETPPGVNPIKEKTTRRGV